MLRRARLFGVVRLALGAALGALGCEERSPPTPDAARDAPAGEPISERDARAEPLSADFTVSGCVPRTDAQRQPTCGGAAPLTVHLFPIVSGPVQEVLWRFGDSTQSSELTPTHSYALPGRYDITLVVSGPGGSTTRTRSAFIDVDSNPLGGRCEVDAQCATGLACLCGSADTCAPVFSRGICTRRCDLTPCPLGSVCADLSLSGAVTPDAPWRMPICLPGCSDAACAGGLGCRDLPLFAAQPAWTRGCFVELPRAAGAACRNSNGLLDQSVCITGVCEDLGAFGMCTPACDEAPCPPDTMCALLSAGSERCLRPCDADHPCDDDPLLACQPSGGQGPRAFTVADAPPGATFCMPRPCTFAAECQPAGTCLLVGGRGHCVRR